MCYLAERVHAGIGASRPARDGLLAGEGRDGLRQTALHRRAVLLELPADKGRAVIFESELVAGHGGSAQHRAGADAERRGGIRRPSSVFLPARCTSVRRTAPSPQAMVR